MSPEKSNFSRRCSLLSRYLKEKGSFGDIDFAGKSDLRGQENVIRKAETLETRPFDDNLSEQSKAVSESGNSQLTIFFGGRVIVYNEFPKDKVNEIMEAAKQASPVAVDAKNTQNHMNIDNKSNHVAVDAKKTQNDMNIDNKSNVVVIPDLNEPTSTSGNNEIHQTKQEHQVVERIARRASLHRFFAKRKDRAVARAPYQVNLNGGQLPPKPEMVRPSVEPGQPSRQPATPPKPKRHDDMSMDVEGEVGQCSKDLELKL